MPLKSIQALAHMNAAHQIEERHYAEAIQYRSLDRQLF